MSGTQSGSIYYHGYLGEGAFYARIPQEGREITVAHGVRCVLDLKIMFRKSSGKYRFIKFPRVYFLQTGSVTTIPVTAPCIATKAQAAARVRVTAIVIHLAYGRTPRQTLMHILTESCSMVLILLQASALLLMLILCAVSWI